MNLFSAKGIRVLSFNFGILFIYLAFTEIKEIFSFILFSRLEFWFILPFKGKELIFDIIIFLEPLHFVYFNKLL